MKNKCLVISVLVTIALIFLLDNPNIGLFDKNSGGFVFLFWGIPLCLTAIGFMFHKAVGYILFGLQCLFLISLHSARGDITGPLKIIGITVVLAGIVFLVCDFIAKRKLQ